MARQTIMNEQTKIEKADKHLKRVSGTIGAVAVIVGAATGLCTWVSNQFQSVVSAQIEEFRKEAQAADERTEVQITRLELMMLIRTQPTNVAEIEKVARHYFYDLKADWYLSSVYSSWAKEYGGNLDIVIGVD